MNSDSAAIDDDSYVRQQPTVMDNLRESANLGIQHIQNFGQEEGPFQVEFKKPYKPVFILFIDFLYAMTSSCTILLLFWYHASSELKFADIGKFMPW